MTYVSYLRRKWDREGVGVGLIHDTHEGPKQLWLRKRIVAACDGDRCPRSSFVTVAEALGVDPW